MRDRMRHRHYLLLCLLLGALTGPACTRAPVPVAPSPVDLIRLGMSEAEVVARLGPPGLITEQPRALVQVPTPTGNELREKRRATWYYPGASESLDRLITFEDGVVVDTGKRDR